VDEPVSRPEKDKRRGEEVGLVKRKLREVARVRMMAPPPRTPSGRRVYDATALRILVFIRRSRELGFSLDEIRALLKLGGPEKASCRDVREIASRHLQEIRAKLEDLKKLERYCPRRWHPARSIIKEGPGSPAGAFPFCACAKQHWRTIAKRRIRLG